MDSIMTNKQLINLMELNIKYDVIVCIKWNFH